MRWNDDTDEAATDATERTTLKPRSHSSFASSNASNNDAIGSRHTSHALTRLTSSSGASRRSGVGDGGGGGGGKEAAAGVSVCLLEYEGSSCDYSTSFVCYCHEWLSL
jgi:hypothetical protein